jgi:Ca-activated chloride channel family protein
VIRRRPFQTVLIGLISLLPLISAPPAFADETTPEAPKIDLVLDVSGSMKAADIDGRTRISVAQQAFNDVVDALPSNTHLGIRVLGATYPGNDKTIACRDTQQIVPVGPMNKELAKGAISALSPTGYTPIGLALRGAAQDLGTGETTRRIILITDGEDTCAPPDPCEVARELAAQGLHLVVDTLGLLPDEKVRKQLLCIASATGGSYFAAQHPEELTTRIKQLVQRAKHTYTRTPATVTGADNCSSAPILSKGAYVDRERFSEHRWYRVAVGTHQELRASASVTLDRPVRRDFGVLLRAATPDGRELVRGTDAGSGRADVVSAGIRWSSKEPTPNTSENIEGVPTICVVVSNSLAPDSGADQKTGLPVELVIDLVDSSPAPASPGLGRGWLFLMLIGGAGLLGGLLFGLVTRIWVAFGRIA